jgi:hypothetical protein
MHKAGGQHEHDGQSAPRHVVEPLPAEEEEKGRPITSVLPDCCKTIDCVAMRAMTAFVNSLCHRAVLTTPIRWFCSTGTEVPRLKPCHAFLL